MEGINIMRRIYALILSVVFILVSLPVMADSGVDFGYDKNKWIEWLKNTYTFKMTPYEYDDNMF